MKKGFPNRILGIPYGWEDRGKVGSVYKEDDTYSFDACGICHTKANIGIQSGKPFLFCIKCRALLLAK